MPAAEIEHWCEIIGAMKVRTTNRKGRHLSTVRILQLLVEHGVETPNGLQRLTPGRLTASTINRHMRRLGYDHDRMTRQPPAVRFQAEHSLWHFDMSPSDLKQLAAPSWIDPDRSGAPRLMLFSVVDDRSGVAYQEYRCVYGEDVESALRFLFAAMARKADEADAFQGIPAVLYLDNGPVAKSTVFKRVMESLGVEAITHMPAGSDGRRTTARAKGKVERPFRTVKDAHETLYHFHQPASEEEANRWLARFVRTYNLGDHRDWVLKNSLEEGVIPEDIIADAAATRLAAKLKTPLQIGQHLVRAFEAGFEVGAKPVDETVVEAVLSLRIDDLESRLTRSGYDVRSLVEQFDAKPAEIRRLLRGDLDPARSRELLDEMRAAGLPT